MATAAVQSGTAFDCPACATPRLTLGATCPGCGSTIELEACRIELWRGYTSASFVARTAADVVAESPSFRFRGRAEPPQTEATHAAHAVLTRALLDRGWAPAPRADGEGWFAHGFEHVVAVPPEAGEPEEAERPEPLPVVPVHVPVRPQPAPVVAAPPPRPAPEPIPAPEPAPAAETPQRRSRFVTILSLAGILVACVLGFFVTEKTRQVRTVTTFVTRTVIAPPSPPTPQPAAAATPAPASTHGRVRLGLTATSDSWVEVRRRSAQGPVVFSGTLAAGQHLRATGTKLWARFAAAGNLEIAVNGKPLHLNGTLERLFVAARR